MSQFWKGEINFTLHGHKLKGGFKIVRSRDKGENAWYVMKLNDKYALKEDIILKDKSVLSKKTLEQVAANPRREWQSHKPGKEAKNIKPDSIDDQLKAGNKTAMPSSASPMLCTLIKEPFNDEGWLYEVKWDGYRIIAFVKKGKVILKSRGDQNYTSKYSAVSEAFKTLDYDALIDGEVVVLDKNGKPYFSALQNYKEGDTIAFYAFDLLWCNGYTLMSLPLEKRKDLLNTILPSSDIIKYSESFDDGIELFETAKKMGIEGIVAKRRDRTYTPGRKENTWYKAKLSLRQEYVIGGWTESDNRQFRSLMFGHYVNGQFTYVHHSGGGFTDKQMKELSSKLKKIEINESPFVNPEKMKTKVHWVKPVLVAEFEKSTNTTASGRIRHPAIFIGLREDKKAKDVVEEIPKRIEEPKFKKEVTKQKAEPNKSNKENAKQYDAEIGSWETLEKRKVTSENELIVEGHKLNLINIERELWPDITKADLIQYYISIADYILLYLRDRPLGLNICLGSPAKGGFFLRGMEGHAPSWAKVFTTERKHKKPGKSDNIEWLLCNDKATLVYIVNFESIDIHPWTSRISSPTNPDYIVIDIDPSDDDFRKSNRDCTCSKTII